VDKYTDLALRKEHGECCKGSSRVLGERERRAWNRNGRGMSDGRPSSGSAYGQVKSDEILG